MPPFSCPSHSPVRRPLRFLAVLSCLLSLASAADIYVDNVRGDDAGTGAKESPFKTIRTAVRALQSGHTLHFVPNKEPYVEPTATPHEASLIAVGRAQSGTPEKPTVIDGHGARILGLVHYGASRWQDEGNSVFSLKLPNNTMSMASWNAFPIAFLDGKPADAVKSFEALSERTFFLLKRKKTASPGDRPTAPLPNTLYVKLPAGRTPADIAITAPSNVTVQSNTDYVTIRNLEVSYSSYDGFGSFWGKGIVFENVRGSFCMDQGISNHSAKGVTVRNSRFDHNVDCGILDISLEGKGPSKVRYENCLVDKNFWVMGGVYFRLRGDYEMDSCIIRENAFQGVGVTADTRLTLTNCIVERGEAEATVGVLADTGSTLELRNCTIIGFKQGLVIKRGARVTLDNCTFVDCGTAIELPSETVPGQIVSDRNCFVGTRAILGGALRAGTLEEISPPYEGETSSTQWPKGTPAHRWKAKDGSRAGANLDPDAVGPKG